jgi:hypothetical protein
MQIARTVTDVISGLPTSILTGLLSGSVIALLSLFFRSVRQVVFYKRHEFEFEFKPDWGDCEWDVQWEGLRVTFELSGVRKAYIKMLTVKVNGTGPGRTFEKLEVSEAFHHVAGWPLFFKLNSVARTRTASEKEMYRLYFVLRRRRW